MTAAPQGGWQSFRQYVYDKLYEKYESTYIADSSYDFGDVTLEFSINKAGKPFNFKILNAPDTLIADAAISIIKDGPNWISTKKNRKKRVTVRF